MGFSQRVGGDSKNFIMNELMRYFLALVLLVGSMGSVLADDGGDDFGEFEEEFRDDGKDVAVADPLLYCNRVMHQVNDKLYFWVVKPTATGYGKVLPEAVRLPVRRAFKNVGFPSRCVNNFLQGKFANAGTECSRFVINTTVGVVGLFDPAQSRWGIEARPEDFGQTLGHYGAGDGFYLVLPALGPSNLRDAFGKIPDHFLNPISYLDPLPVRLGVRVGERVNYTSLHLGEYEGLKKDAMDPYTFFRSAYKQYRDGAIQQ